MTARTKLPAGAMVAFLLHKKFIWKIEKNKRPKN